MSLADLLDLAEPDPLQQVELVTMPESLASGAVDGYPRPFPDIQSALAFARALPADARAVSFIRTSEGALTLDAAEKRLAAQAPAPVAPVDKPSS